MRKTAAVYEEFELIGYWPNMSDYSFVPIGSLIGICRILRARWIRGASKRTRSQDATTLTTKFHQSLPPLLASLEQTPTVLSFRTFDGRLLPTSLRT